MDFDKLTIFEIKVLLEYNFALNVIEGILKAPKKVLKMLRLSFKYIHRNQKDILLHLNYLTPPWCIYSIW